LLLLCADGLFPLSRALLSSSINRTAAITDKIQNAVNDAISLYSANYGWEVTVFPEANMLVLNVPAGSGQNYQFAQNTITQAWTTFTGWNASCFQTLGNQLYFGDATGFVRRGAAIWTRPVSSWPMPCLRSITFASRLEPSTSRWCGPCCPRTATRRSSTG
jgi:hypothetical protein